ncbi:MAG: GntR family transcriptional regulator, N-acetylglucosamine utilization regulator [Solirubrobacteraceae bacterium]|jgi:GntR family transcriptional regulator|nr:GntR family transcriptional regulator, N-acetylglucosamine utilization regulator [Solirubrobacteraceae bacterium]
MPHSLLDRTAHGVPLYFRLRQQIRLRIEGGEWPAGERIPAEHELMRQFGVSRATVREALSELVREGLLERRQGFGTLVRDRKLVQDLSQFYSFSRAMLLSGHRPSTDVISVETVPLQAGIARRLGGTPDDDEVVQVVRLRRVDDEPVMLESSYLPADVGATLDADALEGRSLYDVLQADCGVEIVRGRESFEPILVRGDEADRLGVRAGSPGLLLEREAYEAAGRCVEFCQSVLRGDRARFTVELR